MVTDSKGFERTVRSLQELNTKNIDQIVLALKEDWGNEVHMQLYGPGIEIQDFFLTPIGYIAHGDMMGVEDAKKGSLYLRTYNGTEGLIDLVESLRTYCVR